MIWKQNKEVTNEDVQSLAKELNVNDLLVRIFLNRINDKDQARIALKDFHEAVLPPSELVNGQAVADVITKHIKANSLIFIHADYDVDGLNSGTIMGNALKELVQIVGSKAIVSTYFPERVNGYGLSFFFAEEIIKLKQESTDDRDILVITVDNGIAQIEQIQLLIDNGIEVVVTDHHQSMAVVPNCLICNPHNGHVVQSKIYHHLCGAGVTFKVCELVQQNFGFHDMYKYVPYVAIATITDVMPLTLENMAFMKYGLDIINSDMCPIGIKAIKDFLGIKVVNSQHIAWEIGPRLNACGRMGKTSIGGRLLSTNSIEEAEELVNELESLNDLRKDYTDKATKKIQKMNFDNDMFCVIKLDNIPEGIVGILAGRAVEFFGKPSIVVTEHNGICSGSARSIPGLDLHQLFNIQLHEGNILKYGGHSEAAGIAFEASKLQSLQLGLNRILTEAVQEMINSSEEPLQQEPILLIDECIEIQHLNEYTFNLINALPYDKNTFAKPTFALVDCEVEDFTPTKSKPENLWLTIRQGRQKIKLWCQGMTEIYKTSGCPKYIHLAGYIEKNFMMGRPYTFKVIDIVSAS